MLNKGNKYNLNTMFNIWNCNVIYVVVIFLSSCIINLMLNKGNQFNLTTMFPHTVGGISQQEPNRKQMLAAVRRRASLVCSLCINKFCTCSLTLN